MNITKQQLLSVPKRKADEPIFNVLGVYVLPNSKKHDSGYACMDFVAEFPPDSNKPMIRFGGGCDSVWLEGSHFMMDCIYPSKIVRIWNRHGFSISNDGSDIRFIENGG